MNFRPMGLRGACLGWLVLALALLLPGCERRPRGTEVLGAAPSAPASAVPVVGSSRGLFYEIHGPAGTAYLLGSIHLGKQGELALSPTAEAAFARSDTLVVEVALDAAQKLAASTQLAAAGTYPTGDSLDRHVPPALVAAVGQRVPAGLDPQRFRPWFLAVLVTVTELVRLGYDPDQGIDQTLQERARGSKRIASLESVEQQVALFAGLSPATEELMLRESLDEAATLEPDMRAAVRAWQAGDGAALERDLLSDMGKPEYRPLWERLFRDRNLAMERAIEGMVQGSSTSFVVVGSGHLVGKEGIVALLLARGYRVEQR
jgi:uncharacterized protein